ncbi:MAG: ABC transporter permease [Lachnospiraceae bacterium]|nr:ABC transporter permease [Lachnospiraceae bacterium]
MRFSDKFGMAAGSLFKRKLRTMLTVLGVMIGVAAIVTMMALGEGLQRQSLELIEQYGGLRTVEVREGSNQGSQAATGGGSTTATDLKLSDSTMELIKNIDHVESVYPTLEFQAVIQSGPYKLNLYSGQAVPLEVLRDSGWEFAEGEWPSPGDELSFVFGNLLIQDFEDARGNIVYWNTGKTVDVDFMTSKLFTIFDMEAYSATQNDKENAQGSGTAASNSSADSSTSGTDGGATGSSGDAGGTGKSLPAPKKYIIPTSGVLAGGMDDYNEYSWNVYCDIEALEKLYKKIFKGRVVPGQPSKKNGKPYPELFYSKLSVIVDDIENIEAVQQEIGDLGYQTSSNSEWISQAREQSRSQQAMLGGIGAVSLLVAAIGIANTMMMSIYERTKEIGVMKVIGCGLYDIQQLFLIEAGMIAFCGGITGLGLSCIVCLVINKITETTTAVIPGWMYPVSIVFAIIVSMIAGYMPSKRAMSLSALEAIRTN